MEKSPDLNLVKLISAIAREGLRLREKSINSYKEGKEVQGMAEKTLADSLTNIINDFQGFTEGK